MTSLPAALEKPPRWALAVLLAVIALPPFVARALGSPVGDFAMFSRVGRYHLELSVVRAAGKEAVSLTELRPHLSRDARAILMPAAGSGFGQDQTDLLQSGLADIGQLLCELRPNASAANVRLGRGPIRSRELSWTEATTVCPRR